MTRALVDSGGHVLAGSDVPGWFMLPPYTLHRELENLVAAGLSPFQALVAATRDAAQFFGAQDSMGTIAPGKRADLVLLDANPLAAIGNTQRINGVVLGGRWFARPELDRELDRIAQRVSTF